MKNLKKTPRALLLGCWSRRFQLKSLGRREETVKREEALGCSPTVPRFLAAEHVKKGVEVTGEG